MYLPLEYYITYLRYYHIGDFLFLFVSGFFFLFSLLYLRYLPTLPTLPTYPMLLLGEEALEIC